MEYEIQPVETADDQQAFVDLLVEGGLYEDIEDARTRYEWFYENGDNPAFLLVTEHGEIIGTKGYGTREFFVNGNRFMGAVSCDISVIPTHRQLKPAYFLHKRSFEIMLDKVDFIYGIPNQASTPLYKRSGIMKPVGPFQRFVKPLRLDTVTDKAQWAHPAANATWRGINRIAHRTPDCWNLSDNPMLWTMDRVWEANSRKYGVIGDRTFNYMKWRYFHNPSIDYDSFGIVGTAEIIYYVNNNRVYIVDLVIEGDSPNVLRDLFIEFERRCFGEGYSAIILCTIGAHEVTQVVKKLWYRQFSPHHKVLWVGANGYVPDCVCNESQSFWFPGDEDAN